MILVEFNGKIARISQHCKDLGVNVGTVRCRHYRTGESYIECLKYYQEYGVNCPAKDRRLYGKWYNMMQRCYNPNHPAYKWYGKKGIAVYERWHDYKNFEEDLYESFIEHVKIYGIKDTTIDRFPNKLGNYEPSNIRWATVKEQQNNKTDNRLVTNNLSLAQFSKKYGLNQETVRHRLETGMSIDEILSIPISKYNSGEKPTYILPCNISLNKHCNKNGYCYNSVLNYILHDRLSPHEALAKHLRIMSLRNTYHLPCGISLKQHCRKNDYRYHTVRRYIKKYNLKPHEALAKWLEKHKKDK